MESETAGLNPWLLLLASPLIAAFTAVFVHLLNRWTGRKDTETREKRADQRLFADRFGKAAAQLGEEPPAVRLAGVYAMAALADEWEGQRQQCVDVLCGYLRLPPRDQAGENPVRLTVVGVIREHLQPGAATSWSPLDFDLRGAALPPGTDLWGAKFGGDVWFEKATFGGDVSFDGAKFSRTTGFDGHEGFFGLDVSFYKAVFGGEASFVGATFSSQPLFGEARFGGDALFDGATFAGAAFFRGAMFGGTVSFDEATVIRGIDLTEARIAEGVHPTFTLPDGSTTLELPDIGPYTPPGDGAAAG